MTYYVRRPLALPHQQRGQLVGWEDIVTGLQERADISGVWKIGNGILDPSKMPEAVSLMWPRPLPSVFSSDGGIIICNEKLKSVLEELDPNIHQFIPIKVGIRSGEVVEGNHFILNVHHMLDTIIDEKSKAEKGSGTLPDNPSRHFMFYQLRAHNDGDIAVEKTKLTSVNLWREKAYRGLFMTSNEFQRRLQQENLNFFEPHKASEF